MKMPRVVLDTNVIVSALLTADGFPSFIWDEVKTKSAQAFYSDEMYAEYEDVLRRPKFPFKRETSDAILDLIFRNFTKVIPITSSIPLKDESDRPFYDVATTANATLITGNLKHYPESPHVSAPSEFVFAYINLKLKYAALEDREQGVTIDILGEKTI
ncbi:MAG: putative toxin-antitoxin system toxin component, PIN family [Clostridiales Family XIII bacterium]|jgi:putative PIN family toxin of toxin-antitoxin system|nr:putative toxin-antitoxin system toxin component, PIN family [Clostridiales Family XIII bacterium]